MSMGTVSSIFVSSKMSRWWEIHWMAWRRYSGQPRKDCSTVSWGSIAGGANWESSLGRTNVAPSVSILQLSVMHIHRTISSQHIRIDLLGNEVAYLLYRLSRIVIPEWLVKRDETLCAFKMNVPSITPRL